MSNVISQSLLPEFNHEMATTRRVLERVPEDRAEFKPHPRSMTLSSLAKHVSEIPLLAVMALSRSEFDLNPVGGAQTPAGSIMARAALLASFDSQVEQARGLLVAASDGTLMESWTLKSGGHPIATMPRAAVLRSVVMNHSIHHRAQLTVYLRMNDVPVPSIYGPSADEGQLGA